MLPITGTLKLSSLPNSFNAESIPWPGRPTALKKTSSQPNIVGFAFPCLSSWQSDFKVTAPAPDFPIRLTLSLVTPRIPEARIVGFFRLMLHSFVCSILSYYLNIIFSHASFAIVALNLQRILFCNIKLCRNLLIVGYADRIGAFHNIVNDFRGFDFYLFLYIIIFYYVYSRIRRNNRYFVYSVLRQAFSSDFYDSLFPYAFALKIGCY